jgi:hypothetical protein
MVLRVPLLQNKHKKQGEKNRYQLTYYFNQQQIGVANPLTQGVLNDL